MCSKSAKKSEPPAKNGGCTGDADGGAKCPKPKLVMVDLVEVVTHKGATTTQPVTKREQYINLDDQVDPDTAHPDFGRVVTLKARVGWDTGKDPLDGKTVYWYFKDNKTNDPTNKKAVTGTEKAGFDSAGGPDKTTSTTDADGWTTVPVKFFLSQYGGDTFDVYATVDPGYKDGKGTGTFTVWRKFWYQVTEMKDGSGGKYTLPAPVTTAFEVGYTTVFMRYVESAPRKEADWVSHLVDGAARKAAATPHFTVDDKVPFKCHIMTIDHSVTPSEEKTITNSMTGPTFTSGFFLLWRHGGGTPWKVSAKYKAADGTMTDIPDSAITVTAHPTQRGFKTITVNFGAGPPAPTAAAPVDIELKVKVGGPSIPLGWGGGSHHLFLCTGALHDVDTAAAWDPMQRSDAVHEIGHALGCVNKPPAAANAHDAWEDTTNKKHCIKPATECAMWWASSTTRLTTFHYDSANQNGCHDYLRRQDFSRAIMKDRWKD